MITTTTITIVRQLDNLPDTLNTNCTNTLNISTPSVIALRFTVNKRTQSFLRRTCLFVCLACRVAKQTTTTAHNINFLHTHTHNPTLFLFFFLPAYAFFFFSSRVSFRFLLLDWSERFNLYFCHWMSLRYHQSASQQSLFRTVHI